MLKGSGRLYKPEYNTKKSKPIDIPSKIVKDISYDSYVSIIPEYGSLESTSLHESYKNSLQKDMSLKCSESSNFPNSPFGKSPPNNRYFKSIYLNIIADNNLKEQLLDN